MNRFTPTIGTAREAAMTTSTSIMATGERHGANNRFDRRHCGLTPPHGFGAGRSGDSAGPASVEVCNIGMEPANPPSGSNL